MTTSIEEPRFGTATRWKGKLLLTRAQKLERQRARTRAWRDRNKLKLVEYFRVYRLEHPELKAYHATYHQAVTKPKKTPKAARPRVDAATKHARKLLKDARWRRRHPDKYAASIAASKAKRPDLYLQIAVNSSLTRRARKKGAIVERVSTKRVLARDGQRCHLCGEMVVRAERSLDHLIPVVRGGAHAEWNLMTAHLSCNKRRGTKKILVQETKEAALAYVAHRVAEMAA